MRRTGPPASAEELSAAALQFVRKISGYHHPSQANQATFDLAVAEVAAASRRLLDSLGSPRVRASRQPETSAPVAGLPK